jgi:hypothetical protein
MKKTLVGLLSFVLVFASLWGINTRAQRPKSRQSTDTTLWV